MPTILVIDDERLTGDMLRAILAPQGQEVLVAHSGPEGLRLFREHHPDLVILDLRMPTMDGVEVLEEIRAGDARVPVLILTAWGTPGEENRARGLGVTEFLNKNLSLDVILDIVKRHVATAEPWKPSGRPPAAVVTAPPEQPNPASAPADGMPPQGCILVVDDEPLVGNMVKRYFGRRGYRVLTALNGEEALARCRREPPDVVVLDMHMPGMIGLEVLHALRDGDYRGPIIILSASQDEALLRSSLQDGAIDVMPKPVDLEKLETAVSVAMLWGKD